jgi:hypothetical protein
MLHFLLFERKKNRLAAVSPKSVRRLAFEELGKPRRRPAAASNMLDHGTMPIGHMGLSAIGQLVNSQTLCPLITPTRGAVELMIVNAQ